MLKRCLLILLLLSIVLALAACSRGPQFRGNVLDPPRETLDFSLQDQRGRVTSLQQLRGQVVVLSFLYTSCPDLCPLTVGKMRSAADLLGDDASKVQIVAVTVDPARDAPEVALSYLNSWGVEETWRYLLGDEESLRPLWEYYWVGQPFIEQAGGGTHEERIKLAAEEREIPEEELSKVAGAYTVGHAAPIHLINKEGRVQVVFGATFTPAQLANDIQALLG